MAECDTNNEIIKFFTPPILRLNETYLIRSKSMSAGCFGEVRVAKHEKTNEIFAAKCERATAKNPQLEHECFVYRVLNTFVEAANNGNSAYPIGIAKVFDYGTVEPRYGWSYNALIMEMLGASLYDSLNKRWSKFSLRSVVYVAQQLNRMCAQQRDINIANLVFGRKGTPAENTIHIIDFGLSAIDVSTNGPVGTKCFWSLNSHNGIKQGKRDDVESIIYVIIYLLKGKLEWSTLPSSSPRIIELKQQDPAVICAGLPIQFRHILHYVRKLTENQTPIYRYLEQQMQEIWDEQEFELDGSFEWNLSR